MRILILQDIPVGQKTEHYCIARCMGRAFSRAGYYCRSIDSNGLNEHDFLILNREFDLLIITQNYFLDKIGYVKNWNGYKAFWSIDCHKDVDRHKAFCIGCGINLVMVSSVNHIKGFINSGIQAIWLPSCYSSDLMIPTQFKNRLVSIGFCGARSNRGEWIDRLKEDVSLKDSINVLANDMVSTLQTYRIGWNRNEADDINFRTFEYTGSGAMALTNKTPGIDNLFDIGKDIVVYDTYDDCVEKIKWFSQHENERLEIALSGYVKSKRMHTYDSRILDIICSVERSI